MFIRMRFRSRVSKRGTQRAVSALGAAREWIKGVGAPLGKMYRLKRRLCGKIKLNLTEKLLVSMLGSKLFRRPSYNLIFQKQSGDMYREREIRRIAHRAVSL